MEVTINSSSSITVPSIQFNICAQREPYTLSMLFFCPSGVKPAGG